MSRHNVGAPSLLAVVILLAVMAISACTQSVSDLTVEIDTTTNVVGIIVRNHDGRAREIDDQFLQDYAGSESPLQLSVSQNGNPIKQCRSMDYFGPPKVFKVLPGDTVVLETHVSALIHTFCLHEPGNYSLQVYLVEPEHAKAVSNRAGFVVTQEAIDHHVWPKDSTR